MADPRPPTADPRPPMADPRPPTADPRPPTAVPPRRAPTPGAGGRGGGAGRDAATRPVTLLVVSTWDFVLATGLVLFAFIVFGSQRVVRGRTVDVSTGVQVLQALAYASGAGALVVVGVLMTRRAAWVRRAQMVILAILVGLIALGFALGWITDESDRTASFVVGNAAFAGADLAALFAMTAPRVAAWFDEPGETPLYLGILVAFWAAATTAFFVLGLLS